MKCKNIVSKIRYVGPGITDGNFDRVECGGEMEEKGNIGVMTSAISPCIIYQCKVCKDIKLT